MNPIPLEDWEIAYEAYRAHTGGVSLASGQPIPEAHDLRPDIQDAWRASAAALRAALFCPVHGALDARGELEAFDNCIGCIRVQKDELLAVLQRIHEGASRTAVDSRSRDDDRYCLAEIIRQSGDAIK